MTSLLFFLLYSLDFTPAGADRIELRGNTSTVHPHPPSGLPPPARIVSSLALYLLCNGMLCPLNRATCLEVRHCVASVIVAETTIPRLSLDCWTPVDDGASFYRAPRTTNVALQRTHVSCSDFPTSGQERHDGVSLATLNCLLDLLPFTAHLSIDPC